MTRASVYCIYLALLVFEANVRKGWKGLPGTRALAYFASSEVTKKIKFDDIDICPQSYQF
jgi:hypothetical protein